MTSDTQPTPNSPALVWIGRVLSALPALLLLFSAYKKFEMTYAPPAEPMPSNGWPSHLMLPLGIVELICTLLYIFPQTAVVGAILLTGYMGGAIATHVRVEDQFVVQTIVPIVIWLGIYLRDARLRELIPWRS